MTSEADKNLSSACPEFGRTALVLYRQMFQLMLKERRTQRIGNESVAHARVLIEELIRHAKQSVDVFCHRLSSDVWSSERIVAAVRDAIARNVQFRIVVQERLDEEVRRSAFAGMHEAVRLNCSSGVRSNFLISDRQAFRFEYDCNRRQGFAYANNPMLAGKLVNAFETLYNTAD